MSAVSDSFDGSDRILVWVEIVMFVVVCFLVAGGLAFLYGYWTTITKQDVAIGFLVSIVIAIVVVATRDEIS